MTKNTYSSILRNDINRPVIFYSNLAYCFTPTTTKDPGAGLVFVNNRDIQSNIADATEIMIHESILVNKLWDSYFFKLN